MKQILIIPDRHMLTDSVALAQTYGAGFEYNDFFQPEVLDDSSKLDGILAEYKEVVLPEYCTIHGAFFDVIPFSPDRKIREISDMRVNQSMDAARRIGAKAVVFHTNYNPFLNSEGYRNHWVETNVDYWGSILSKNPDLNLYLENMFDQTPDLLERISKELCVYDNYGVCLDYSHAFLSKTPTEKWARCLGPFVKHVHINDTDGISDLHMAWGDGVIDRESFYRSYHDYLRNAAILIETTGHENKIKSLQRLKQEGFLE